MTCKVAATTASAKMHLIVLIAWIGTAIPTRLATYPHLRSGWGISHIDEAAEVDVIIPYLFRSYIIVVSKDRREAKCPILKL